MAAARASACGHKELVKILKYEYGTLDLTPVALQYFFLSRQQSNHWGESDCFGSKFISRGRTGKCTLKMGVTDSRDKRKGRWGKKEKGNVAAAKHLEVAFFTLSVFPLFFSSPHVIVFCINPFTSLRASRRLVCFFLFYFF